MVDSTRSLFFLPKYHLFSLQQEEVKFASPFSVAAKGLSRFLADAIEKFHTKEVPASIYLFGVGVLSNEWSKNFNIEEKAPDLIFCTGGIRPVALVDIKYRSNNFIINGSEMRGWSHVKTKGEHMHALCNVAEYDEYLAQAAKAGVPVYVVNVYDLEEVADKQPTGRREIHYFAKALSEPLKEQMTVRNAGKPSSPTYYLHFDQFLVDDAFWEEFCKLFPGAKEGKGGAEGKAPRPES